MIHVMKWLGFHIVDESVQPSGSFKGRGVAEQLRSDISERTCPLVTFTSGNHGIAMALEANRRGREAIVVVPRWIEARKHAALVKLGCQVVVSGDSATECENAALDVAKEYAGFLVHPFRSPSQIRGYTTLWKEIAERFPDGADVVVPVGSGGLLAAGMIHRREAVQRYRIVGVEPDRCSTLSEALQSGRPRILVSRSDVAMGLNVNTTPDEVMAAVRDGAGLELTVVSDSEMYLCLRYFTSKGILIDPASSAVFAYALFRQARWKHKDVVLVLTGRGTPLDVSAQNCQEEMLFERWVGSRTV